MYFKPFQAFINTYTKRIILIKRSKYSISIKYFLCLRHPPLVLPIRSCKIGVFHLLKYMPYRFMRLFLGFFLPDKYQIYIYILILNWLKSVFSVQNWPFWFQIGHFGSKIVVFEGISHKLKLKNIEIGLNWGQKYILVFGIYTGFQMNIVTHVGLDGPKRYKLNSWPISCKKVIFVIKR